MIALNEGMARLCFASAGFILAAMAMVLFVWRDSRPRKDEWQTIVRDRPSHVTVHRPHKRSFEHRHYDTSEHDDDRIQ